MEQKIHVYERKASQRSIAAVSIYIIYIIYDAANLSIFFSIIIIMLHKFTSNKSESL